MKKLLFSIFVLLFGPAHSQTLYQEVTRQAAQTVLEQSRQTQIRKALQLSVFSRPWEVNWEDFLIENSVLQVPDGMEETDALCQHLFDSDCELFTSLILGEQHWRNNRPDYAQETNNVKYIYVSDSSGHGTKTIRKEVTLLLKQIRRAHPQVHILLALEFAERKEQHALPIHFAKETSWPFAIDDDYAPLIKMADKLDVDILGLDDYIPAEQETPAFKMGDALVQDLDHPNALAVLNQYQPQLLTQITQHEEQYAQLTNEIKHLKNALFSLEMRPQNISPLLTPRQLKNAKVQFQSQLNLLQKKRRTQKQEIWELNRKKILYLHDFVSRSPWGMDQRNTQWARYIKAIDSFYDIIITYAGNAHLSLPISGAALLPKRIGQPFVLFDFYTQERLRKKDAQAYEQLAQIQAQENPGMGWWEEIEQDEMTEFCSQYAQQPLEQPYNLDKPFFIKNSYPSAASAAGQDPQRRAVLREYNADLEFTVPHTDFSVFLPDYSKCFFPR